ncbi:hypothetical protein RQP46_010808 [Phenoliferia psychrophenolica]
MSAFLRGFWALATSSQAKTKYEKAQTASGIKDKYLNHFIDSCFAKITQNRVEVERAHVQANEARASRLEKEEPKRRTIHAAEVDKIMNDMATALEKDGDTPVEILHMVLLGFIKLHRSSFRVSCPNGPAESTFTPIGKTPKPWDRTTAPSTATFVAKVLEIVGADGYKPQLTLVRLERWNLDRDAHSVVVPSAYGIPTLIRSADVVVVSASQILCPGNTQHDCATGRCTATGTGDVHQERVLVEKKRTIVAHKGSMDRRILNTASLRSFAHLRPFTIDTTYPTRSESLTLALERRARENDLITAKLLDQVKKKSVAPEPNHGRPGHPHRVPSGPRRVALHRLDTAASDPPPPWSESL